VTDLTDLQEMVGADVLTLGMAADQARRAQPDGHVVTYLRVHIVTPAALASGAAIPDGAAEVRLHETPATLDEAIAQTRALRAAAGARRVAAFSLADVLERRWGPLETVLSRLLEAGLDDVAELPVDRIDDPIAAIHALMRSGMAPRRLTVFGPTGNDTLEIVRRVHEVMEACPEVRRVAPLPRRTPVDTPTTGYQDVRTIALTRLAVGGRSVEVDWALYGPKLAQVALTFGADHLDNVAATSDPALGWRRATVEEVERNIRAAGFEPREYRPA
jgi:aminodeoxyfutalosine synthase